MEKPAMIYMPAHRTNTWSRNRLPFEFIVLHYVGAVSTARDNGTYYGRESYIGASAHFFVDEHEIVSSVPLNLAAGHCGVDYSGGKAPFWSKLTNKKSIGIEMCCKKDSRGNWYIEPETVTRTVALVKWLMQEYNIDINHVIRHYDVCWKTCPEPWVRYPEQWENFKARLVDGKNNGVPAPINPPTNTKEVPKMDMLKKGSEGYQVKVAQLLLILNGCSCGSYGADGDFGPATDSAVRKYQKAKGLEVDRVIGPKTWAKLLGV